MVCKFLSLLQSSVGSIPGYESVWHSLELGNEEARILPCREIKKQRVVFLHAISLALTQPPLRYMLSQCKGCSSF